MKNKVISIIVSIELLIMLIIPLVTFNWVQGTTSVAENRTLTAFPTLFDSEGEIRDDLLVAFDDWFKDNIGLRDYFINLSSIISFNVFHKSTSENVEIGRDGWLFYNVKENTSIATGTYPNFEEEKLAQYCEQLVKVRDRLKKQGREFVIVLPPSKVSIYPEYMQSGDYQIIDTPVDILADYLEAHSDLRVVRVKDALLEEKDNSEELLYFKTDTHWNYRGRYVGYKKIIQDFNTWGLIDSDPLEANFYRSGSFSGDLANMMGAVNFAGDKFSEGSVDAIELSNSIVEAASNDKSDDFYALMDLEGVSNPGSMWVNPDEMDAPSLLVYGDSMIGSCIIDLLAANFSETAFIWSPLIKQEMIDLVDPDIVVFELAERSLCSLPGMFDSYLNTEFVLDEGSGTLDVCYHGEENIECCYMSILAEDDTEDDIIWAKADNDDDGSCHATFEIDEKEQCNYNIQIYNGSKDIGSLVASTSYYYAGETGFKK